MCTCLDFQGKDHYFGRTLDLEYHYNEEVVITPRNFTFDLRNEGSIHTKYAIIGMATVINDYPLYYEASNEKGLSIAGLYFPGNAEYFAPQEGKLNLPSYEIIPYFLGLFTSIEELRPSLEKLNISNDNFSKDMPLSPLHWMISDGKECLVIEQTANGLQIYENKTKVMTNNPPFNYQLEALEEFKELTPKYKAPRQDADGVSFDCVGCGSLGLPGDYSSTSRFVRTAFLGATANKETDEKKSITQFFHILSTVSMIKGTVLTKTNEDDMTVYASCINTTKGIYYYKTYDNSRISAVCLTEENMTVTDLGRYKLQEEQDIHYQN